MIFKEDMERIGKNADKSAEFAEKIGATINKVGKIILSKTVLIIGTVIVVPVIAIVSFCISIATGKHKT